MFMPGPCPTQELPKGLRRTKAKPAMLQALPTGSVQQNGCKLESQEIPSPRSQCPGSLGIRNLLSVAVLRCWLLYGVKTEQGEGKGAPVCGTQPGDLLGILGRSS